MKKQITTLKRQSTLFVLFFCSSLFLSAQVYKTVNLTTGGTLGTVLTATELSTVTDLTVTTSPGVYLTSADFTTMGAMPVIANIDLSGASAASVANPGFTIPAVFTNKISLKSFKFPANVRNITANTFTGSGLTGTFTIPATLNTTANINSRVVNCPGITAFAVDAASTTMKAIDGVLFDITGTTLALYPGGKPGTSYSIPAGTTTVSGGAFSYVTNLTDLNIPASLTAFGNTGVTYVNTATVNSPALQNITVDPASAKFCSISGILVDLTNHTFKEFPQGNQTETLVVDGTKVTNVQGRIFQYASKLKSTIFTEGVTTLAYQTFKPNSTSTVLAYVELPSTITTLGNEVFSGCSALKQIACKAITPPTVGSATFNSSGTAGYLVGVPEASISTYQTSNWIYSVYSAAKGFTTAQVVAYRNITTGAKVTCLQTVGIPTKSVSITAGTPDPGYSFSNWSATPTVTFASVNSMTTTFTMPATDVSIQSVYTIPVWSGTGNWSSTSNWSTGTLPATASSIVVNNGELMIDQNANISTITVMPGAKLTLNSGKTLTAATLNLNSDATGTGTFIDKGTSAITTANVQQYLTSGRNWYVSSPVTGAATTDINTTTGSSVVSYDEVHGSSAPWIPESSTLTAGKGYAVLAPVNAYPTIVFRGTLNTGNKPIALTRTTGQTKEGFNLVGNPYPAHLAWTEAIAASANVLPTIWYRTATYNNSLSKYDYSFITYNAPSGISVPAEGSGGFVPPMQAFWVRANAGGGTLTFNNNMCSHSSTANPLKAPDATKVSQQVLRLQVSNNTNSDEAVIFFNANASNDYDVYDSPKMTNANAAIPEIYTMAGTEKLVINGLNGITPNEDVSLGFTTGQSNLFTIKATQFSNFDATTKVYLRDNLLNTEQDLTDGLAYSFSSNIASSSTRFSVIFKVAGITTGLNKSSVDQVALIYMNAKKQITVKCQGNISSDAIVSVCDLTGKKLQTKKITSTVTLIDSAFTPGVYAVTVSNGGKVTTQKVILN